MDNHKEKCNSSNEHLKKLKSFTINQLLENLTVSKKYKRFREDINKKIKKNYLKILGLKNFLE